MSRHRERSGTGPVGGSGCRAKSAVLLAAPDWRKFVGPYGIRVTRQHVLPMLLRQGSRDQKQLVQQLHQHQLRGVAELMLVQVSRTGAAARPRRRLRRRRRRLRRRAFLW